METSPLLDHYKGLVSASLIQQIYEVAHSLAGLHVLHVNTTAQGGGVAEILRSLLPLVEELGIHHDWKVIPLDEASGYFMARLVDMLQGYDTGAFPEAEKQVFLEKLRHAVSQGPEYQADVYFIHDYQLVPLVEFFPWMRPAIWFCHVDTAHPIPSVQQYIQHFLDPYAVMCFNSPASVFKGLLPEKVRVVTLGIDPFRVKNRDLPRDRGMQILSGCGIDPARPLITQVSRFAGWKNPWQVIEIYRLVKRQMPAVQLALVGAIVAKDDMKAEEILADLQRNYVHGDADIHLLSDPTIINHAAVNAFQRYSSVILQRSIREGFGFTVTEAMWKKQPVVGTRVTGLQMQITHGSNGYLVDEAEAAAVCTLTLLQDRDLWHQLGANAYETVRQRFLFPVLVLDYLKALQAAWVHASARIEPEGGWQREVQALPNHEQIAKGDTMAIQEQLERLSQGAQAWNVWREENPSVSIDLRGANLRGADLRGANLRGADLSGANLRGANLRGAYLIGAKLSGAGLIGADLSGTYLSGADLVGAHLVGADLSGAKLSGADLSGADLSGADLSGADLSRTALARAALTWADLRNARLEKANFDQARLGGTIFNGVDLRSVKGLETVIHVDRSTVDLLTVELPFGSTRRSFLQGVGFSDTFIDYLPSLLTKPTQYASCFISYANQDEIFTRKLYADLQNRGVRCWFAPEDLKGGNYFQERIDQAVQMHDKLLVVLSEHSIASKWVREEVRLARSREVDEGREILFPIRLDQAVMESSADWAVSLRKQRHLGDFTNWSTPDAYQQSFERLLRGLKADILL